jgi:hypothetical protein
MSEIRDHPEASSRQRDGSMYDGDMQHLGDAYFDVSADRGETRLTRLKLR